MQDSHYEPLEERIITELKRKGGQACLTELYFILDSRHIMTIEIAIKEMKRKDIVEYEEPLEAKFVNDNRHIKLVAKNQ